MENYDIKLFDFSSASKEEWTPFHKYRRKRMSEISPDDPIETDAVAEERIKLNLGEVEIKSYVVVMKEDPSDIIAWLQMSSFKESSPSYSGNEHVLRVGSMAVLKDYRRKGIGLALLELVHAFSVENEKRVIIGSTMEEEGRALNRILGGIEALELRDNRLNMDEVDWKMIETWEQEGAKRSTDTSLEFYTSIPEEILEDYCKKYTEVNSQAPLDDLDVGDTIFTPEIWRKYEEAAARVSATWLTAILREKNGDISGISDVLYVPSKAPLLIQQLTGVDQNYRGQGKGKWVKAAMLLKVREEFPDIKSITTGNATSNAPMLSINERMGFKLHREIFNLQIETEKLGKYLEDKQ